VDDGGTSVDLSGTYVRVRLRTGPQGWNRPARDCRRPGCGRKATTPRRPGWNPRTTRPERHTGLRLPGTGAPTGSACSWPPQGWPLGTLW